MYKIQLQDFEGPLDLLLFFIKRDEIDIYDIPISKLTKEFIQYTQLLEQLDLDVAGEFILMASTLMQIKVRMLLPREVNEKGEEIDPREDLVKALLEYKRYKEMSEEFIFLEQNQRKLFFRNNFSADEVETPPEFDTLLKNITIYDLIKSFKKAIEQKQEEIVHEIKKISVTIEMQASFVLSELNSKPKLSFLEIAKKIDTKITLIVTVIAILELIKMEKIGVRTSFEFNDFEVYKLEETTSGKDLQFDY